ncbi:ABC transporter permease [Aeromicrobium camelliae]|uniref:ABC transporter permease n=1 Tax=Aeromicrobium camelliae TaxID=1538144 RepID=A0A3N6WJQ2_9ACTN|nr:ABC transporter permease [Aeromicrobium camelliae]RQN07806.1 ABC transporter permease [Aeromicrobium camelliae]
MSTTTYSIDTQRPGVSFGRLIAVEFRKSFDTRAGRWFTGVVVALAFAAMLIQALLFVEGFQDLNDFTMVGNGVIGFFIPIIPILLVTQEWGQRTALVTFTLEPRRMRVVIAKLIASVLVVLGVLVVALAIAALGTALAGGVRGFDVDWSLSAEMLRNVFIGNLIAAILGFALAMLIMSTPGAIVTYFIYMFAVPTVLEVAAAFLDWFADVRPWIDFASAQTPLFSTGGPSGEQWGQLLVSSLIWLVLPLVLGVWRLLKTEVK